MFKKNVGGIDRALRVIAGAALIAFALGVFGPSPYAIYGWIGVVPLLTAFIGFCPAYVLIGLSTCPTEPKKS
jgi:hypothetical protein